MPTNRTSEEIKRLMLLVPDLSDKLPSYGAMGIRAICEKYLRYEEFVKKCSDIPEPVSMDALRRQATEVLSFDPLSE